MLAHPIRLSLPRATEAAMLAHLKEAGLAGLEVYHSEHPPALQAYYRELAAELKLLPTGGSDFHGAVKPDIELGSGRANNVRVPVEFLKDCGGSRSEALMWSVPHPRTRTMRRVRSPS